MHGFKAVIAAFLAAVALAFTSFSTAQPQEPPDQAGRPTTSVERIHDGHVLCVDYDIYPVARFKEHYTDSFGNHYHGWIPPVGPPFYVECFDAAEQIQ